MDKVSEMKVTAGTHDKIRKFLYANKENFKTDEFLRLADIASMVDLQVKTKTAACRMTMEQIIYSVDNFEKILMEQGCCGYERITI